MFSPRIWVNFIPKKCLNFDNSVVGYQFKKVNKVRHQHCQAAIASNNVHTRKSTKLLAIDNFAHGLKLLHIPIGVVHGYSTLGL